MKGPAESDSKRPFRLVQAFYKSHLTFISILKGTFFFFRWNRWNITKNDFPISRFMGREEARRETLGTSWENGRHPTQLGTLRYTMFTRGVINLLDAAFIWQ